MAGAIIGSIIRSGMLREDEIAIADTDPKKQEQYGKAGHPVRTAAGLVTDCGAIVLAVKPQQMRGVLSDIADAMTPDKLLISIAAGVTAQAVKSAVGFECKVVLAMPNMPLALGYGATALARAEPVTQEEFSFARSIFEAGGITEEIPADKMNEIIPINGSSPAFLYRFAQLIADEAQANGIAPGAAMNLFCQAMIGSAKMLMSAGKSPGELVKEVCSPGGTTLAGLAAMEEHGFDSAVRAGFAACVRRAKELADQL